MDLGLQDRSVLITGAASGIGLACVKAFAAEGANLAICARDGAKLEATAAEVRKAGVRCLAVVADLKTGDSCRAVIDGAAREFGRIDVLVNNAANRREAPLADISADDWHATLRVVLDGAFFCTQGALALLKASPRAAVVNIGGLTAHTGAANRVHVVTAKAGLVGMTRALAHDFADSGITVNCVAPGMLDTQRDSASASAQPAHHAKHRPLLGRRGSAQEVADSVRFLASDGARFITGQVLHVNGGTYLGG